MPVLTSPSVAGPKWLDAPLIGLELAARQTYWRSAWLRGRINPRGASAPPRPSKVGLSPLMDCISRLGAGRGQALMVHAGLQGICLDDGFAEMGGGNAAVAILGGLRRLLGTEGTLAMPTHPLYPREPGFMTDKSGIRHIYDPIRTPSRMGILSEIFRRSPGVIRSHHPLSPLAALGPLASTLLQNNLNSERPLPHGIHSAYYRFCLQGGLVVGINTRLINALTIVHTAEEVRDESWPVADFFYERSFSVRSEGGEQEWTVRERRPYWARNIALEQLRRELLREHILRETSLDGVRIEAVDARSLFHFMMQRNATSTFPYYFLLSRR